METKTLSGNIAFTKQMKYSKKNSHPVACEKLYIIIQQEPFKKRMALVFSFFRTSMQ